jgi:hypothetical protein
MKKNDLRHLKKLYSEICNDWGGSAAFDRSRLMEKERHEQSPSVQYEIDGILETLGIPMNFIRRDKNPPHPAGLAQLLDLMGKNDIVDSWRAGEGQSYPDLLNWLDKADKLRLMLIAYMNQLPTVDKPIAV